MTTTDLIAEMLRNFREEILKDIDEKIRKHELQAHKPHFTTKPAHECVYSKAMNQPYPRLCIKCGVPQYPKNKIEAKNRATEYAS